MIGIARSAGSSLIRRVSADVRTTNSHGENSARVRNDISSTSHPKWTIARLATEMRACADSENRSQPIDDQ